MLARVHALTDGRLPLIGVGGVGSAEQAYAKIRAGASAVQLYTALVYGGLALVRASSPGLDALLARDGFATVAEAVGRRRGGVGRGGVRPPEKDGLRHVSNLSQGALGGISAGHWGPGRPAGNRRLRPRLPLLTDTKDTSPCPVT